MVAFEQVAAHDLFGDAVDHLALDEALERTGAEHRVVAVDGQRLHGRRGNVERDATVVQALAHVGQLQLHDGLDVADRQGVERDDVIDTVEELGAERGSQRLVDGALHGFLGVLVAVLRELADELAADVARHDDDRVLEADHAALTVGQATVVEHLQQHVEHVGVRLLYLVEQHHAVGTTAHGLGELAALVIADVAGRRADEALHAELLHILGHVDAHHGALAVEQVLGQRLGELGLAHAGRSQEQEAADGLVGIGESRAVAADGTGHDVHGVVLAHDALVQLGFQVDELLHLALHHLGHGDARPSAHDLGDLLLGNLFLEDGAVLLALSEDALGFLELGAQLRDGGVAQLGRAGQVAFALGALLLALGRVEVGLDGLNVDDDVLLVLPLGRARIQLLAQLGHVLAQRLEALLAGVVALALQRKLLDLHLAQLAVEGVELLGHAVDLDAQTAGGLVHEVDGLVGQESVGDVAVGQLGGCHDGAVGDAHAMVDLVLLLQATQDGDGVLHAGLADEHGLEAALQRSVLLDVLAVLVERRGADGVQLAARQRRLEHVARVDGAVAAAARTDDGMQLVDEQDDAAVAVLHFAQHGLQAVLELAAVLRTGQHAGDVERDDVAVLKAGGHVAADDALRQPFHDGRLAGAGLADEHGVVLRAPAEHLHGAADFLGTADDRVELALASCLGEVRTILVQRIELHFGVLVGDAFVAAELVVGFLDGLLGDADRVQHAARIALVAREGDEQVLGRGVAVAHLVGDLLGPVDGLDQVVARSRDRHAAAHLRLLVDDRLHVQLERHRVGPDALQDGLQVVVG